MLSILSKHKDALTITLLFVAAFFLWTLPLQKNPLPFGEHDAAYIFSYGDDMSYKDKSYNIIGDTPLSTDFWYAEYNPVLGPRGMQYPPPYNLGYAFAQILGGERIIPPYLYIAVTSFAAIFSLYFLVRKLYGYEAALISSVAILFSHRTILLYLWGQRHNIASFTFIPLGVYALYKYLDSFYKGKEDIRYLYLYVIILLCTFLTHLGASIFFVPFTFFLILFFILKKKKLPYNKKNLLHYGIFLIICILTIVPFYHIYFSANAVDKPVFALKDAASFLQWHKIPENNYAMNPLFSQFTASYSSYWVIPLLLWGVFTLLWRRNTKDITLLAVLLSLYVIFHLSALGLVKEGSYRIGRVLIVESYFFYTVMAVGLVSLSSFFVRSMRTYARYGLTFLFIVFIVMTQGSQAYASLSGAYEGISRITPQQYEFVQWAEQNIPQTSAMQLLGTLTYAKKGFMQVLSRRVTAREDNLLTDRYIVNEGLWKEEYLLPDYLRSGADFVIPLDYVVFDYSDLQYLQRDPRFQGQIAALQQMEQSIQNRSSLIYDRNAIRVYHYDS